MVSVVRRGFFVKKSVRFRAFNPQSLSKWTWKNDSILQITESIYCTPPFICSIKDDRQSRSKKKMIDKAERLFQRMKDADLPIDVLVYNEMITLYISVEELDKVPTLAKELKRQNVSPDLFTYNLRISASVASMDLKAFKGILDEISKDPNSNEGWMLYRNLASIYVDASQLVSSGNSLVEAEAKISQSEWITYDSSSSCTPVSATWTR